MASTTLEPSGVGQSASTVTTKKKRLNPARRKAAKANAEAEAQKTPAVTTTEGAVEPSQPAAQPVGKKPVVKPPQSTIAKANPPLPIKTLQRQNTEPLSTTRKPNLSRTITAPPSTDSPKTPLSLTGPALITGGLVGCAAGAAILLGVGIWYDFSGAEQAILTAKAAKLCVDNLAEEIIASLKAGTYSADEALDMLRRTTLAYASTIPEGAPFVERVFREIDMVRKQRGREIDKVVAETYGELQKAGRRGASSVEMRSIVVGQLTKLSSFASRATRDVVARNPNLRSYRDGAAKALEGPPESKVPTVRVNMAVRQKPSVGG